MHVSQLALWQGLNVEIRVSASPAHLHALSFETNPLCSFSYSQYILTHCRKLCFSIHFQRQKWLLNSHFIFDFMPVTGAEPWPMLKTNIYECQIAFIYTSKFLLGESFHSAAILVISHWQLFSMKVAYKYSTHLLECGKTTIVQIWF